MTDMSPNLLLLDRFASQVSRVEKPWGYEILFAHTERYAGKLLFVRKDGVLSLQFHNRKDEVLYLHEGRVVFEIGEPGQEALDEEVVLPGRAFRMTPGTVHRMRALEDSVLLETSTPELDDIVRLDDKYGRTDPTEAAPGAPQ